MKENQTSESSNEDFFLLQASIYFNAYILFICLQELTKLIFLPNKKNLSVKEP